MVGPLDIYVGVLFALGGTLILGSFLLWLGWWPLLVLTAVLFLGTELTHPDPAAWAILNPSTAELLFLVAGGDLSLWSNYPVLPWLELVTFGLVFGYWFSDDSQKAYSRGLRLGLVFLLTFMILRLLDGFGNIRPRPGDDWIDFFNVVKYPPSMTFTLLTTGVNLVVLWLFSRVQGQWYLLLRPLSIFGRAPLFFLRHALIPVRWHRPAPCARWDQHPHDDPILDRWFADLAPRLRLVCTS